MRKTDITNKVIGIKTSPKKEKLKNISNWEKGKLEEWGIYEIRYWEKGKLGKEKLGKGKSYKRDIGKRKSEEYGTAARITSLFENVFLLNFTSLLKSIIIHHNILVFHIRERIFQKEMLYL